MNRCANIYYLLIVVVVAIAAFVINNQVIVPDIMESRNIVTAREMVREGNWIVPTMNGDLRLEKPPLPTWITAVAEQLAPDSLFAHRAVAGLSAIMMVIFFFLTVVLLNEAFSRNSDKCRNIKLATMATLVLCTCYTVILMGRTASWDIYCHAFMMGTIFFATRLFVGKSHHRVIDASLAGIMAGLSFMSKGPVSFYALMLPFLLSYAIISRPRISCKALKPMAIALVCAIVTGGWWYGYMYTFHHAEMGMTISQQSGCWLSYNVRPWYYYWSFFLESGVWALLLVTALAMPIWSKSARMSRLHIFAIVWTLTAVVLLSLLPEKKMRYLMPVMLPSALTIACALYDVGQRFAKGISTLSDRVVFRINAVALAVAFAALPVVGYIFLYQKEACTLTQYVAIAVVATVLAIAVVYSAIKLSPKIMLAAVVLLFAVAECFVMPMLTGLVNNPEMKSIAAIQEEPLLDNVPFYHNEADDLRIELVYAANRKIRPLDFTTEEDIIVAMPCAVVTHKAVGEELPASLWNYADSLCVGSYDDNRWSKKHRRYSDAFLYRVTLLSRKQQ